MTTYNIGDMIIIPYVNKIGVIIDIKNKNRFPISIFWQYECGETDIVSVDEKTITLWLSTTEGKAKDNKNQYYPVPK